jgi:hypothetical protein
MGKFNLSKKAISNKDILISILYHDTKVDLNKLLKFLLNKNYKVLLTLDGVRKIKIKKNKNLKILFLSKRGISKLRNYCLDFAIKNKFKLLLFLDSDCYPSNNVVEYHVKKHNEYQNCQLIGGSVRPTFLRKKNTSLITTLDGIMSWFGVVDLNKDFLVKFPYHLPTLNMSIKLSFIKQNKIRFRDSLVTGEDYQFCKDVKKVGGKILRIKKTFVDHIDRNNFRDVLRHQATWGRHQFYTLYSFKFNNSFLFKIFFLIFYLPLIPLFSLIFSIITLHPWCKKNLLYSRYFFLIFLIINIKCFYSYIECINNL